MKKLRMLFVLAVAGLVSFGLTGCNEGEKAGAPDVAPQVDAAKTAAIPADAPASTNVLPAAQMPKDHPAH